MGSFQSPDDLSRFVAETCEELDRLGLSEAAAALAVVQATGYTTGSEWLGALGTAVRRVQSHFTVPPQIQERLDRIMTEVHRAWPSL